MVREKQFVKIEAGITELRVFGFKSRYRLVAAIDAYSIHSALTLEERSCASQQLQPVRQGRAAA